MTSGSGGLLVGDYQVRGGPGQVGGSPGHRGVEVLVRGGWRSWSEGGGGPGQREGEGMTTFPPRLDHLPPDHVILSHDASQHAVHLEPSDFRDPDGSQSGDPEQS